MSRWFPGSSIAISFSTRGALIPPWMVQHVAAAAGASGLDVDAASPVSAWLASQLGAASSQIETRSLWIPLDAGRSQRHRRLIQAMAERQPESPPHLVLLLSTACSLGDVSRAIESIQSEHSPSGVSIGLPSPSLRGGRPHLVHLGGIRRFAEEWDVGVAIDLSGRFDPTWEAEAAVARLGNRLRLLRLSASAPSRSAVGRDRVACRALHAAMDRSESLVVGITSPRTIPFPMTPRAAANAAQRAASYVSARAVRQAEMLREGIDRFEGTRSQRWL
jgi:hypothetical protein